MEEFKRLFFTYFKSEPKAEQMFGKILPFITNKESEDCEISIQKLAKLIDSFSFYPVKVNMIKSKNNSDKFTSIYA